MANYNLVVNTSSFKPYDILGMYLPILTAEKNQYDKNVESLDKIAIENGLYIPPDGKYKDMKDLYTADLMDIASKVSNGELSTRAVNDIRRRYYKDIVPIDKAAEAYNKYQDKLTALGPDAIIGNRSTFDDFYGGKNQQVEYRSAKTIQSTAAGVMQGLDNALMRSPEIAGKIAKQYFILRQRGLDGEQALSDILNNSRMDQLTAEGAGQLVLALDKVYNTFSKDTFSDDAKGKIWENTVLGAILGIQAPKYSLQTDHSYESDAQRASREYTELQRDYYKELKSLEEEEKNLKLGKIKIDDGNGKYHYEYNPKKAKELLDLRRTSLGDTSTKVTPHITYGGHRYSVKKVSDIGKGLNTYEVSDIDTGEIITNASLKLGIVDYYNGVNTSPTETPPNTPQTPKSSLAPLAPADSISIAWKNKLTS